jgi:hypothetical protein
MFLFGIVWKLLGANYLINNVTNDALNLFRQKKLVVSVVTTLIYTQETR